MARRAATRAITVVHSDHNDRTLSELLPPLPKEDADQYADSLRAIELSEQRALLWLAGVRTNG